MPYYTRDPKKHNFDSQPFGVEGLGGYCSGLAFSGLGFRLLGSWFGVWGLRFGVLPSRESNNQESNPMEKGMEDEMTAGIRA